MNVIKNKLGKKTNKHYEDIHYSCTIRFLDDSEPITVTFQKETKGQWLLDYVCKELNLLEKDYFGLRFVDVEKQRHWLDPVKPIYRQIKNVNPIVLCFRVKFYPSEPMKLKEEITRYFLFLQLRRDLHHGRLLCSPADANLLAAYIIQSEVGDYDPQDHQPGYVSEFKMLPKQTQKQEDKIAEIHKTLVEQVPSEAEGSFLQKASTLDTYGVDPHPVKDHKASQMYLGITHLGIVTFQGNKRTHLFKWAQINKIAFEGKMFIVHVTMSEKKHACGFKCQTFAACKHLWKCAVEQQYFFTKDTISEIPKVTSGGGLFSRGCKFRFSGRVQKEVYSESSMITRDEPQFVRSASNPQLVRNYGSVSKSATLPSSFRSKDSEMRASDIGNLSSQSDYNLDASLMSRSSQVLESTIPEQDEVTIADHSYQPLSSPEREELPPLPDVTINKTADRHCTPDDDMQKRDLKSEFDECAPDLDKVRNQVGGVEEMITPQQNAVPLAAAAPVANNTTSAAPKVDKKTPSNQHNGGKSLPNDDKAKQSWLRSLAIALLLTLLLLCVLAYLLFESEADIPGLKDVRQWPEVAKFREERYMPMRSGLTQKVGGWFKA